MKRRRLILAALIGALLLPNRWEERRAPAENHSQSIAAHRLRLAGRHVGPLVVGEAWVLTSANTSFGGYSSMALPGPRRFLLLSDFANVAEFTLAPDGRVSGARQWPLYLASASSRGKFGRDSESMIADHAGRYWVGFEQNHRIIRFTRGLHHVEAEAAPGAMQGWNANGGAEAMTRLADGRFLVLSESSAGPVGGSDALLFAGDPTLPKAPAPLRFSYDSQGRGLVTDAATLPDGRVLLLHRRISLLNGWQSTLAIADPATIRRDRPWRATTLARIDRDLVAENFEGMAIEPTPGGVAIWIVSDDNRATWQRTILLRLDWPTRAPGSAR